MVGIAVWVLDTGRIDWETLEAAGAIVRDSVLIYCQCNNGREGEYV